MTAKGHSALTPIQLIESNLWIEGIPGNFPSHRQEARDFFKKSEFPTTKTEAWRFTKIDEILKTKFEYDFEENDELKNVALAPSYSDQCLKIDIINGLTDENSINHVSLEEEGISLKLISDEVDKNKSHSSLPESNRDNLNAFSAMNMALFTQVISLKIAENQKISKPILLNINSQSADNPINSNIRINITGGKHSEFSIIESYSGDKTYFNNSVVNIFVGCGTKLNYYKIQNESNKAYNISNTEIYQKQDSLVNAYILSFSGKLIRNDIQVDLKGEGAEVNLLGLTLGQDRDHIDNTVLMNHCKPHCMSNQLFKSILDHKSHGVFSGLITVFADAQKTDARQKNQNLILSDSASMNSNPQLEINADDVRCSHGSTTGQLDDEAIFYLRSRGIPLEDARKMLINGFSHDIIKDIDFIPLKESLKIYLDNYLT